MSLGVYVSDTLDPTRGCWTSKERQRFESEGNSRCVYCNNFILSPALYSHSEIITVYILNFPIKLENIYIYIVY